MCCTPGTAHPGLTHTPSANILHMFIFFKDALNSNLNKRFKNLYIDTDSFSDMQLHWELSMVAFSYPKTFDDEYILFPVYFRTPEIARIFFETVAAGLKDCKKLIDVSNIELSVPEHLYQSIRYGDIIDDKFVDTLKINDSK